MKRIFAALMFFTRLPLWRWVDVPSAYFSRVVELWPLVGWLTGGIAALVLYGASLILPTFIAVILAVISRMLLTGALHEDGLADFCDGFGGGSTRERILTIMKDSHIGTYGTLGLIVYVLLLVSSLSTIPMPMLCFVIVAGDSFSKFCAAQIINFLPYARKAEDAKSKTIYTRFGIAQWIAALIIGVAPILLFLPAHLYLAALAPIISAAILIAVMRQKIGGYTGDCCGATFSICELSFYLTIIAIWN